jgi:hypothetical protein
MEALANNSVREAHSILKHNTMEIVFVVYATNEQLWSAGGDYGCNPEAGGRPVMGAASFRIASARAAARLRAEGVTARVTFG